MTTRNGQMKMSNTEVKKTSVKSLVMRNIQVRKTQYMNMRTIMNPANSSHLSTTLQTPPITLPIVTRLLILTITMITMVMIMVKMMVHVVIMSGEITINMS